MKTKALITIVALISLLSLAAQAATNVIHVPTTHDISLPGFPFPLKVTETDATKELNDITNKSVTYLLAKNYDQLDQLADRLRSSKECWATGTWKLWNVYSAMALPDSCTDSEWHARLLALTNWVDARPESATARVALANFLVDYGWRARGGGVADTVTEDGWQLFGQRLSESVNVLRDRDGMAFKCPAAWSVLMTSSRGLNIDKPQFNALFEKAVHAAPDYQAYYVRRAIYLLPRWNGDEGEWELDLAKSADRIGDEKGDKVYAQVIWCMHKNVNFKNIFQENKLSWDRVDRGFAVIEKDFPTSLAAKNERAHLAVLARDYPKARKYFEDTQGKVDLSEWDSFEQYIRFVASACQHSGIAGLTQTNR